MLMSWLEFYYFVEVGKSTLVIGEFVISKAEVVEELDMIRVN